jgi:Rrf2 family protein
MAANSRFAVAVHALALIAWRADARHCSREIADSVATNPVVIRRLLAQLARAGIVESAHGAKGGFRLARPAAQVSLHDVYRAVEEGGFFALAEKSNEKCPVACRMKEILDGVFARVESKVLPELKRATLADVVRRLPRPAQ